MAITTYSSNHSFSTCEESSYDPISCFKGPPLHNTALVTNFVIYSLALLSPKGGHLQDAILHPHEGAAYTMIDPHHRFLAVRNQGV